MGGIQQLTAAVMAGISVFCLSLFFLRLWSDARRAGETLNEDFVKELPVLLKMGRKLSILFLSIAKEAHLQEWRNITGRKLGMAGYGESITAEEFLALKIGYGAVGVLILILCCMVQHAGFGIVLGLLLGLYPGLWLNAVIKQRHLLILKALPNVLDLLTLSVEAGKDFVTSLRDILARRKQDPLGEELTRAFQEIQLGRKRADALRELANRVGQNDLTAVLNAIIQAEELGVSIGNLLRIQGDLLRNKRFTLAEKLANEAPVKIVVPIVAFVFPAVILILAGPIITQVMHMFGD